MQRPLLQLMLATLVAWSPTAIPALGQSTIFATPGVATDNPDHPATVFRTWDVLAYHNLDYEPVPVLSLPARTVIDAVHKMDAPNDWLFSVDATTELPPASGVFYQPEDVILYDGSAYTCFFDGSANGVPSGANIDAVFLLGGDSGDLVISFDVPTTIGAETFASSDLVRVSAGSFQLYLDASAAGSLIDPSSNLIGAAFCGETILVFDVATDPSPSAGPTTYTRGDVAVWDGAVFGLFDTLAGWPPSSTINALSCCADEDGDILCSAADNCPLVENAGQENSDGDPFGDACDVCPYDSQDDIDADGICGDIDNCPQDPNPAQANVDGDAYGDLCDPCPATAAEGCESEGSTAEEVLAAEGGTIDTPDGNLTIEIEPGDLAQDTTVSVTQLAVGDGQVDLSFGSNPGLGQSVAVYDLEPDGLEFFGPVSLSIVADVSDVNPSHFDRLTLYLWTDTDGDGSQDTFVDVDVTVCTVVNDPPSCDPRDPPTACVSTATCTAEIDHFSIYALVAPLDGDDDGIPDLFGGIEDICPEAPNVIVGFLPPMTDLVPAAAEVPLPDKAFKTNRTLPLRFDYLCGDVALTDESADTFPELLELWYVGDAEPLPIIDPDSGEASDSGIWFRYSGEHWIYNFSTQGLDAGTYHVHVKMPDRRIFTGGFVLR